MRTLQAILATALVAPCAAQLSVSVKATNDAGVCLQNANGTRVVKNHAKNTPFKIYERISHDQRTPHASLASFVTPLKNYPYGPVHYRVAFGVHCIARKNSGLASLHTTGNLKGDLNTQHHEIDIKVAGTKKVRFDWYAEGYLDDAAQAYIKFTVGSVTKTFHYTTLGPTRAANSFEVTVTNSATMTVEIGGLCRPGTGRNANINYDGFRASLSMNIREAGTGTFKTFGTGCSQGKIGPNGTPTTGTHFGVTLKGEKPNTSVALLWGFSKDYYQNFRLPLDLSHLSNGCWLNVSFFAPFFHVTDSSGYAQTGLYLPWNTSGTLYAQWVIWDPTNPSIGPRLSKGAEIKY